MSSKAMKSILKERELDLYEEVETARSVGSRAEKLFDQFVIKKVDNYSNFRRKPLTAKNCNSTTNQKPIDSSASDIESNDSKDGDFEPSAKTSRTKIKRTIEKRINRVKFAESSHKRAAKKTPKKKKSKAYPDCTKQTLLEAFQSAGLPDYEEIAKMPLHMTKVTDIVKPDEPTPPMHQIMAPFADLIDWSKVDKNSDERNLMSGSAKQKMTSDDWETESSEELIDGHQNDDVFDEDIQPIDERTVISNNESINKSVKQNISKLKSRRESLKSAGVGAQRVASTPLQRRHNVTIKNVSPINAIDSPEVESHSTKSVIETDNTFVKPFTSKVAKSRPVPKISVPKENRPLELDVVDPSISDLEKVKLNTNSRSKRLTRSLMDASDDSEVNTSPEETVVENTIINKSCVNSNCLRTNNSQSLRNRTLKTSHNELSSIFDPLIGSTPLVSTKQKQRHTKNPKYELVVDRSHFDVSMAKLCRSNSTPHLNEFPKTTTIVPVLDIDSINKPNKSLNRFSNPYHLYRKSIASVHTIYNKSCQPFRTVVRTSVANNTIDDLNEWTVRTKLNNENDLKRVFNKSLSSSMFSSSTVISNDGKQSVLTAKQKVLLYCERNDVIDFSEAFDKYVLNKCKKIGEGSYGEVFASKYRNGRDVVIKIIRLIQNENQTEEEVFAQILPELVISLNFNRLKTGTANKAPNFIDMLKAMTTRGEFPKKLIDEWLEYDAIKESENDDPRNFTKEQLYIILHLGNGGTDLESYKFNTAVEALSIFAQLAMALAAAESAFEFEHRDLHWGNVLISSTTQTSLEYCVNGKAYSLPPNGVFASIIDFSLSRMTDKEFIIFDDLAKYSDLFEGVGDYQFDVYRLMKKQNKNDWQTFVPKTNVFWLHYILDKTINSKKYSSNRNKFHRKAILKMKDIFKNILDFKSASDVIENHDFSQYLSELK